MNPAEPASGPVADVRLAQTEHGPPALRKEDLAALQVPVPQPVVGSARRQEVSLLAAPQLFLQRLARGHVAQNAGAEQAPVLFVLAEGELELELATIGVAALDVSHALAHAARVADRRAALEGRGRIRRQQRERLALQVVRRVAEHVLDRRVGVDDPAARIEHDDGVHGALDDRAVAALAAP
jgi:hypothetical protein